MKKMSIIICMLIIITSCLVAEEKENKLPIRVLIPGWYQIEKGETKGRYLLYGELSSLLLGIGLLKYNQKLYNDYMDVDKDGIKDTEDNEVITNYNFAAARKKIDLTYNIAQISLYTAAAILVYSVFDATMLVKKETNSKVSLSMDKKNNLSLFLTKKFSE